MGTERETWAENPILQGGAEFKVVAPETMRTVHSGAFGNQPELFGCIRVDGGVKAALAELLQPP